MDLYSGVLNSHIDDVLPAKQKTKTERGPVVEVVQKEEFG
jgi:hypothetical protein